MIRRSESHTGGDGADGSHDMLDPAGRLTNDVRLNFYQPPDASITDPFEAAGVRVSPPGRGPLLNGRYLVCDALSQSPRGGVFRAIDVSAEPARVCLLKEAWHDVGLDQWGRDAHDWAANEEHVLTRYAGDPFLPRFYDRFELDRNCYIAIEYIEGTPFVALGSVSRAGSGPASVNWTGRTPGTTYEWYVTVSDGHTTSVGPTWRFTTQ
jgi:hypothetical protein